MTADVQKEIRALQQQLYELSKRVAATGPAEYIPSGDLSLLVCRVGNGLVGFLQESLEEVVPMATLAPIPESPVWIAGLLNLRGRHLPVIDVHSRIERQQRLQRPSDFIVVTKQNDTEVGLVVQTVEDFYEIARERFEEAPNDIPYGSVDVAVQALQAHADHFLIKPVELRTLETVAERVLKTYQHQEQLAFLRGRRQEKYGGRDLEKVVLPEVIAGNVRRVVQNPTTTVLILGETGTGKGMLANLIHELSVRRDAQFVDLNCSGLSTNLLEMELFGYERGAFTDARQRKRGLFEIADGGTVFLDEIADMPIEVQARLLKVIEDRTFRRLGGTQVVETDVRVIAATNADLDAKVSVGSFRTDLYYRINVMPIELPPLRERRDQIPLLAAQFLNEFGRRFDKPITGYSREVLGVLTNYLWPGNIRELRNIIERSVLLCDQGEIGVQHLPGGLRTAKATPAIVPESASADASLAEVEAAHIRNVLANNGGHLAKAAKILGINRSTLRAKIKKYGL